MRILLVIAANGLTCGAQNRQPEAELRAAFLYNFVRFTEWPAAALAPGAELRIAIVGQGATAPAVEAIDGRSMGGYRIAARYASPGDALDRCQVVYVCNSEQAFWPAVVREVAGLPVLLVSDVETATRTGGVLRLFWVGNRLRFEINVTEARRRSLRVAPELLSLAEIYREEAEDEVDVP